MVRVNTVKLAITPKVIPNGLLFPLPVTDEDRIMGNNGQIQGARIVTKPDINANSNNKIMMIDPHQSPVTEIRDRSVLPWV